MNDERFLRSRFEARWKNIEKASEQKGLKLPDKEALWRLVLYKFNTNFNCEYCNQELLICDRTPPYYKSFSIDHRTSIDAGGTHDLSNIAIICTRCNIIKGTMTEQTYRVFLQPMINNPILLNQVYREMWNGRLANKLERESQREELIKPKNFSESDSTLPGCLGSFGTPLEPNGPCNNCRDKIFCEQSYSGFGIEVQAWQDGEGSKYTTIISKDWPECLGQADSKQRQGIYCALKQRKCKHQYLCGYIWRT